MLQAPAHLPHRERMRIVSAWVEQHYPVALAHVARMAEMSIASADHTKNPRGFVLSLACGHEMEPPGVTLEDKQSTLDLVVQVCLAIVQGKLEVGPQFFARSELRDAWADLVVPTPPPTVLRPHTQGGSALVNEVLNLVGRGHVTQEFVMRHCQDPVTHALSVRTEAFLAAYADATVTLLEGGPSLPGFNGLRDVVYNRSIPEGMYFCAHHGWTSHHPRQCSIKAPGTPWPLFVAQRALAPGQGPSSSSGAGRGKRPRY